MPSHAEIKAQMIRDAEKALEQMLAKRVSPDKATLSDIESVVRQAGEQWMQALTQTFVDESASDRTHDSLECLTCHGRLQVKGPREREVATDTGDVTVTRAYYYCPACATGVFPPR